MAEKINKSDFIELDYTGKLLDGSVFDTTVKKVAQDNNLPTDKAKFGPMIVCVGEQQILPGLDAELSGKEVGQEYTIKLAPENAFGKRDVKNIKIIPISAFKEQNMQPQPGLQIDVDGRIGTITRVSGGRIIVNFNHPLSGKEVVYEIKILRKVEDVKEKLSAYLNNVLKVPADKLDLKINEDKAEVKVPFALPAQFLQALEEKTAQVTGLKEVKLVQAVKSTAEKKLSQPEQEKEVKEE